MAALKSVDDIVYDSERIEADLHNRFYNKLLWLRARSKIRVDAVVWIGAEIHNELMEVTLDKSG